MTFIRKYLSRFYFLLFFIKYQNWNSKDDYQKNLIRSYNRNESNKTISPLDGTQHQLNPSQLLYQSSNYESHGYKYAKNFKENTDYGRKINDQYFLSFNDKTSQIDQSTGNKEFQSLNSRHNQQENLNERANTNTNYNTNRDIGNESLASYKERESFNSKQIGDGNKTLYLNNQTDTLNKRLTETDATMKTPETYNTRMSSQLNTGKV